MRLGPLIAAYRAQHRYGVRGLAKEIGVHPATLNRIENGKACDSDTLATVLLWLIGDRKPDGRRRGG